jgi:hypothetical protein
MIRDYLGRLFWRGGAPWSELWPLLAYLLLLWGEVNLNTKGRMLRFARLFLGLISRRRSVPLIVVAVSGSSTAVHQCS